MKKIKKQIFMGHSDYVSLVIALLVIAMVDVVLYFYFSKIEDVIKSGLFFNGAQGTISMKATSYILIDTIVFVLVYMITKTIFRKVSK